MRGKKAKALRRKVYGDISLRARDYVTQEQFAGGTTKRTGARVATGFRRVYQDAKRHT